MPSKGKSAVKQGPKAAAAASKATRKSRPPKGPKNEEDSEVIERTNTPVIYNSNVNLPRDPRKTQKLKTQKKLENAIEKITKEKYFAPHDYEIREIPYVKFLVCLKRLFDLTKKYKDDSNSTNAMVEDNTIKESAIENAGNYDDIFMKQIFLARTGYEDRGPEWKLFEERRRFHNGLAACLGDFHEELAGKFEGWRTLHTGHWSGVNVMHNVTRNVFMEWKNRAEYSSKKKVFESFERILKRDGTVKVVLVHVNVPDGWTAPEAILKNMKGTIIVDLTKPEYRGRVFIVSGKEAYYQLSGSHTFYDRLVKTLRATFTHNTFEELAASLQVPMDVEDSNNL